MTFLFVWPLALGLLPELILLCLPRIHRPGQISANLYHSGVATVTVSSLLRGIFEIAGTSSDYQQWMMLAGIGLLAAGILAWMAGWSGRRQ